MKKLKLLTSVSVGLAILFALIGYRPVLAGLKSQQGQQGPQTLNTPELGSSISYYSVVDQDGAFLGTIAGLILDTANNQVDYLVFSSAELLGEANILVPWGAFDYVTFETVIVGEGGPGATDAETGLANEELLNETVYDANGSQIGNVEDVIEDEGERYAVLDYNNRFIPVPVNAFRMDGDRLLFDQDIALLDDAPSYRSLDRVDPDAGAFNGVTGYWEDEGLLGDEDLDAGETGLPAAPDPSFTRMANDDYAVPADRALLLNVAQAQLRDAPEFDPGLFDDDAALAEDWDAEEENFWGGIVDDFEMDASEEGLAALIHIEYGIFDGIDYDVENPEGRHLGEVENLVIDPDGNVPFAVVETDSFLDLGDDQVVVDMAQLNWSRENEVFYLNVEEGALENAPVFDPTVLLAQNWADDWNTYWSDFRPGEPTTGQTGDGTQVLGSAELGSDLLTYTVVGTGGTSETEIGDVGGMVIDTVNGQVRYLVINSDNLLSGESALVPWRAFSIAQAGGDAAGEGDVDTTTGADNQGIADEDRVLLLNVDEGALASAPAFDPSVFADDQDLFAGWDDEARTYWSNEVEGIPVTGDVGEDITYLRGLMYIEDRLFDAIDFDVENLEGEHLGEVENLVVAANGDIAHALVETDTFLGLGGEQVVVAMTALERSPEDETFFLNVDEDFLQGAPVFNEADFEAQGIDDEWDTYWSGFGDDTVGEDEGVTTPENESLRTNMDIFDSEVADTNVRPNDQNRLGTVERTLTVGAADYLVIRNGSEFVPVPRSEFRYDQTDQVWYFNGDTQSFDEAPSYRSPDDIDPNADEWHNEVVPHWSE